MRRSESPLSASTWNRRVDEIVDWYTETRDRLVKELLSEGHPPFTSPTTPREQFDILTAWQAGGDPRYWENPKAQADLARLAAQFGPPQAPLNPMGTIPLLPYGQPMGV